MVYSQQIMAIFYVIDYTCTFPAAIEVTKCLQRSWSVGGALPLSVPGSHSHQMLQEVVSEPPPGYTGLPLRPSAALCKTKSLQG